MERDEGDRSTSSVSKGCFLFNPGSLQPTQKKTKKRQASTSTCHFIKLPLESEKDVEKRYEAFTSCWANLNGKIEVVITKQHDKVFANLLGFISVANDQLNKLHQTCVSAEAFRPPRLEIPTAVIVAGVNMPDHDVLFQQLRVMIRNVISPHVVLLKSSSCVTGMKATMKEILLQLSNGDQKAGQSSDVEESHSQSLPHKRPALKLPNCSMDVLCRWYRESCDTMQNHLTPTKKQPDIERRPPVVIIVEDFEAFNPVVLQDLITSISPRLPEFPVVLILGVATSVRAVHCSLARSASSLLCLEVFHTQHSALTLQQIITETLMEPFPFKLGPGALQFLLHQFFYCNFSLVNFMTGLKFAVMEHFYWQPLSVVVGNYLETGERKGVLKLSHGLCEAVRATPSFQRYVECRQSPEQQILLLENDKELQSVACGFLDKLYTYHKTFFPVLECLHILTRELPNKPLGTKIYELYLSSLEQTITDCPKFLEAWNLVKMTSKEDLTDQLTECVSLLESRDLLKLLQQFKSFLSQLDSAQDQLPMEVDSAPTLACAPVNETTSERKMKFQERLRQVKSRKREPTAFELQKNKVLDSLLDILKENLLFPSSLTLYEVLYFDNVSSMRKQLAPAPRASLQTALSTPHYYLPSAGHVTEASSLDRNMPDVCVAYQLHLECGRLINLYDWLQAFVAVVGNDSEIPNKEAEDNAKLRKKGTLKQNEVDPLIHARFIQAVSELQFLGFIKPTQRKTDHVQRLTWGAC